MPSKTPKARVATPLPNGQIPKRQGIILSCSKCKVELVTVAFEDPEQGEGWPSHRCQGQQMAVKPFSACRPDPFKYKPGQ